MIALQLLTRFAESIDTQANDIAVVLAYEVSLAIDDTTSTWGGGATSRTDPEEVLYRKGRGKGAKMCFGAHGPDTRPRGWAGGRERAPGAPPGTN